MNYKVAFDMTQNSINFGSWEHLAEPMPDGGKPRLFLSFSGGRTSGVMTKLCLENLAGHFDIVVGFANTGEEDERTLQFARLCDEVFGFRTVWLEAVVNPEKGEGTTHRVVTFETASRNGEPFEAVIQKYGIPNPSNPHCTRELKLRAMDSYLRSIGWTRYYTAIGIRPDESRRVNKKAVQQQIVYPLIDWFHMDKQDVNDWWAAQPFDLGMREHEGNCRACWKKSDAKLFLLARERRQVFDFSARMEGRYPRVGAEFAKDATCRDRVFFRMNRSAKDILAASAAFASQPLKVLEKLAVQDADANGGCSESCELYPMLDFGE